MRRLAFVLAALLVASTPASAEGPALDSLERAVTAEPENLLLAADYRQRTIAAGQFDRAIDFFERLAGRKGSGPNVRISLALARVDKVPVAGEFRRLYLGRDAIGSLTKSIEQRPSVLAYYVRGLINLYYNNFIFHRVQKGIDDLETAAKMVNRDTPTVLAWHVHMSLGDGYWRALQPAKAREVWKNGLSLFPDSTELGHRVRGDDMVVERIVHDAVDPDTRVDTSLQGWVP
jgi:tetratricopeptide (TPR) repeat protein